MKKLLTVVLVVSVLTACNGNRGAESRQDISVSETRFETEEDEIRQFMLDEYGISEEELEGYDLIRLMNDYDFRNTDYLAWEVREILEEQGQYYNNPEYTKIFHILDTENGGKLEKGSKVDRIGFLYNEGTEVKRLVFDLKEGNAYNDSTEAERMSGEQVQMLEDLADDYGIYGWDSYYGGVETKTTGSLGWKLVFECSDGSICTYSGYTQDMTHLPEKFSEVTNALTGICQ